MQHDDNFTPTDSRSAHATPPGYSATAKALHWLIVLLVLAQFVVAFMMPGIGRETVLVPLITRHFSLGVLILIVMAIRLVLRLRHPVPLDTPGLAAWERWSAYATHRLFYLILLIGPFLGWASASAHSLSVNVFGVIPLPSIAAPKAHWALTAGDIHTIMMWTLLVLIVLHVAAALYHHFFRHDDVLRRMLPGR